jgi:hypothetical protein
MADVSHHLDQADLVWVFRKEAIPTGADSSDDLRLILTSSGKRTKGSGQQGIFR